MLSISQELKTHTSAVVAARVAVLQQLSSAWFLCRRFPHLRSSALCLLSPGGSVCRQATGGSWDVCTTTFIPFVSLAVVGYMMLTTGVLSVLRGALPMCCRPVSTS